MHVAVSSAIVSKKALAPRHPTAPFAVVLGASLQTEYWIDRSGHRALGEASLGCFWYIPAVEVCSPVALSKLVLAYFGVVRDVDVLQARGVACFVATPIEPNVPRKRAVGIHTACGPSGWTIRV